MALLATASDNTVKCRFHNLPTEILLEIISSVPFSPSNLLSTRLTCAHFHDLLTQHERSIAADLRKRSFSTQTLSYFPELRGTTFDSLARIHNRLQTLSNIESIWLQLVNHGPELHWLKDRWEGVHKAGLLLLYRLQDVGGYEQKVALLDALPAASLCCLLFKLVASVKILRVLGPDPIRESWARGDVGARSDVELACEECLLLEGPQFFVALLEAGETEQKRKAVEYVHDIHEPVVPSLTHCLGSCRPSTTPCRHDRRFRSMMSRSQRLLSLRFDARSHGRRDAESMLR